MIEIKRKTQQGQQTTQECATSPYKPVQAQEQAQATNTTHEAQNGLKRQIKPFTAIDSSRNYRAMYRAACDFHERHSPPRLDDDNGGTYWTETTEDIVAVAGSFDNDPFIMDLLIAVYNELEREYKFLRGNGQSIPATTAV